MNIPAQKISAQEIADDLSVFADVGTDPASVETTANGHIVRLIRHGEPVDIVISTTGALVERTLNSETRHANFKALLASDRYGNLRDWATKQKAYLDQELNAAGQGIDVKGLLNGGMTPLSVAGVDEVLAARQGPDSTRILLIDGPAGIGKTQFIMALAASRVNNYSVSRRPPILHVQSRGRTLSYLYDLVAFSLQRIRLEATYDQVPILAKHGLITLAIDGFDELADPDGYNLAWSQVSDLTALLRGSGALILAGRETFIGRDRVVSEISSVREGKDEVSVLTLQAPSKGVALDWLESQGWNDEQRNAVEEYLEPTSLALRPFFLAALSNSNITQSLSTTSSTSVLAILMEAMIEREIKKFGEAVEAELTVAERHAFLRTFSSEIARDMAENSTTSISDATLSWLVEAALPKVVSDPVLRLLKARAQVVAFLTNDDRSGYRRFFHEKFYEYFLSISIIDMISSQQTGKVISRTNFGSSLLETFGEVVSSGTPTSQAAVFLEAAQRMLKEYPPIDSTRKNIGALLLASLGVADLIGKFEVAAVDLEECRFSGTAAKAEIDSVIISQLDCRGGDLTEVSINNSAIVTLIADSETRVPSDMPVPSKIQDITLGGRTIIRPEEREEWIANHLLNPVVIDTGLIPPELRQHDMFKLLFKACRLRQYWMRRGDDMYAARILDNPLWPVIERALSNNNLLTVELRQASGSDARFIHVRRPEDILSEKRDDPDVVGLFKALRRHVEVEVGLQ